MHAAAGQRMNVDGGNGGQGLALAGLHFRYFPFGHNKRADQLYVEQPQTENPLRYAASDAFGLHGRDH